jgi:salicylate hydroxylase
MASRTVIIAGAGIGGLAAALALAQRGFRVSLFDPSKQLEEAGAGIQLSPNASRVLIGLGLEPHLRHYVVRPEELRVMNARTGRVLARAPLAGMVEERYGAPYWVVHRADLQAVLVDAIRANPEIHLHLETRVEDFAIHRNGVTASTISAAGSAEERGMALVGADGLWSTLRKRLGERAQPRFARHTAWRALVPAEAVPAYLRAPAVNLWLGRHAHLVHYPVRSGSCINIVAIVRDNWREQGWSARVEGSDLRSHYPAGMWPSETRELLAVPHTWGRWALYDRPPLARWGEGAVTLLGDAAHPMLPYLAQGAATAIEDAAVLAARLAETSEHPVRGLRRYELDRRSRTARIQRIARRNGWAYHVGGAGALLRTLALAAMGRKRILTRYDWLYGWKPP